MALETLNPNSPRQRSIVLRENRKNNNNNQQKNNNGTITNGNPQFTGLMSGVAAAPVVVTDAITNGGFAFSFIAQDFFGMAFPRILEGINRRPVNPDTGKKEGPYNWTFARREGIREVLSGPSAFIIPAGILAIVKKFSGEANNVPVNLINIYGSNIGEFAKTANGDFLKNKVETKKEFYKDIFKNMLRTTLGEGTLSPEQLEEKSEAFMKKALEIENAAPNKKSFIKKVANIKVEGSPEDLADSFLQDIMKLKKQYVAPSANGTVVSISYAGENAGKSETIPFKKLLSTLTDFSDDVIKTAGDKMKHAGESFDAQKFIHNFVKKRSGSRIATNLGMWSSVVGFYALIPKLYSLGLHGQNPAFATENQVGNEQKTDVTQKKVAPQPKSVTHEKAENSVRTDKPSMTGSAKDKDGKEVSFCGKESFFHSIAEKAKSSSWLNKIFNSFEFNGPSMSVSGMLLLLFGFCLPTRLANAPDKYDRNETWARDLTSFTAILFGAQGLARGFSKIFSSLSGLALCTTPEDHGKNLWTRVRDYFSPMNGINVLDNNQLASKYTNIHEYKDGINGFFDFITENGGNVKKLLQHDKKVEEHAKIIIGKDVKDSTVDEIRAAFNNINSDEAKTAKKAIEDIFKDSKNSFVKSAKLYNSLFTALSTIVLVPVFMVWLARTCDKMTRKARAKDQALKAQEQAQNTQPATTQKPATLNVSSGSMKSNARPNMKGFLAG